MTVTLTKPARLDADRTAKGKTILTAPIQSSSSGEGTCFAGAAVFHIDLETGKRTQLIDGRTGNVLKPSRPRAVAIVSHGSNSRRFRCVCGELNEWPQGPRQKVRVPEKDRDVLCQCGVLHIR